MTGRIKGIEQENPVRLMLEENHPLEPGDLVEISKVRGMRDLNGRTFRVRDRLGDATVTLETEDGAPVDATAYRAYGGGGVWQREKSMVIAFPQDNGGFAQPRGAASRIAFEFTPLPRAVEIEGKSPGDMRNYTETMARRKLVAQGFRVEVIDVAVEDRETDGLVLGQIPDPEAALPPNGVVRLLVARRHDFHLSMTERGG